jgi:hypothetical protein
MVIDDVAPSLIMNLSVLPKTAGGDRFLVGNVKPNRQQVLPKCCVNLHSSKQRLKFYLNLG